MAHECGNFLLKNIESELQLINSWCYLFFSYFYNILYKLDIVVHRN
jgi:hypothetical protein